LNGDSIATKGQWHGYYSQILIVGFADCKVNQPPKLREGRDSDRFVLISALVGE
jgi:hypothetical protein